MIQDGWFNPSDETYVEIAKDKIKIYSGEFCIILTYTELEAIYNEINKRKTK